MQRICLIVIIGALFSGLAAVPFTLFYTNDTHGAYLPSDYRTADGNVSLGGYENLHNLVSAQRKQVRHSLWLDAGDQQTGSAFSSLVYKKAIGGAVIAAFNKMGLDGATFGNHEFDQSYANTMRLAKLARYPFISTNLLDKKTGKPITDTPYKIFKLGKLRVGVMGLTLMELPEKVKIENVSGLTIRPYKEAIDNYLGELDRRTDLIILLTHNGFEADSLLASQLDGRIDLIVGGHTHTVLETPRLVNGIYIVQTGAFLINYGRLDLEVENDRIVNPLLNEVCLFPVTEVKEKKSSGFSRFFHKMTKRIEADLNRVVGYAEEDWIPDKFRETAVSRWQAEALFDEHAGQYGADLAMLNCGGIRKAIPAGPVRLKDMMEMLPFTNYIVVFSCYGKDLSAFISHNLKLMQTKEYDIVQSFNLRWPDSLDADSLRLEDILVGGRPIEAERVYRVVTHDYLAGQADKYLKFEPFDLIHTQDLILDVMLRQLEKRSAQKKL